MLWIRVKDFKKETENTPTKELLYLTETDWLSSNVALIRLLRHFPKTDYQLS